MNTHSVVSVGRTTAKAFVVLAAVVGLFTMVSWVHEAPFGQIASNAAYAQSDTEDSVATITWLGDNAVIFLDASGFPPAQRGRALSNAVANLTESGDDRWQSIMPMTVDGTTTQLCLHHRRR